MLYTIKRRIRIRLSFYFQGFFFYSTYNFSGEYFVSVRARGWHSSLSGRLIKERDVKQKLFDKFSKPHSSQFSLHRF